MMIRLIFKNGKPPIQLFNYKQANHLMGEGHFR